MQIARAFQKAEKWRTERHGESSSHAAPASKSRFQKLAARKNLGLRDAIMQYKLRKETNLFADRKSLLKVIL